jgi:hypothetical protein
LRNVIDSEKVFKNINIIKTKAASEIETVSEKSSFRNRNCFTSKKY